MKKVFMAITIISFIFGNYAFAWQNPCNAVGNSYVWDRNPNYVLAAWTPANSGFSPQPNCAGSVVLWDLTGGWPTLLNYVGNGEIINIGGIPCHLTDSGELECKIITQPEISTTIKFNVE